MLELFASVLICFLCTLIALVALKLYTKLSAGFCDCGTRLDGQCAVLTGGGGGIGRQTALRLAAAGARLILPVRSVTRGRQAALEISRATGNQQVHVVQCDLSSLRSVRECCERILRHEPRLDLLVLNAGMVPPPGRFLTEDFLELQMASNHFGHFLMANLLLPLMERTAGRPPTDKQQPKCAAGGAAEERLDARSESGRTGRADQPADSPEETTPAGLTAEKPAEPSTDRPVDNSAEQATEKPLDNPADQHAHSPAGKSADCAVNPPVTAPAEPAEQHPTAACGDCPDACTGQAQPLPNPRIVVVSSLLHRFGSIRLDNLSLERRVLDPFWTYCNSKLANLLLVRHLSARLAEAGSPVTVNGLHPGLVRTGINRRTPFYVRRLLQPIASVWAKSPREGAQTTVHLCLSRRLTAVSGGYFVDCRRRQWAKRCDDAGTAERLWKACEVATGIS